ncbi:MAG: TonB-dependent receptor [Sphingosinicella sp.]|nr:TonB-dependent receptor [Sphingosinicella sp.]
MHQFIILAAAAINQQQVEVADAPEDQIVVTGSRESVAIEAAPVSVAVLDREQLEALALPLAADVLRLFPGVSVASTGPKGTQTQVRIRGAEANHSLLFVDGIRFNDPAAGNEPRFELLTTDSLSRIEMVRGPQSALWGSEALGGVVAIETANPLRDAGFRALGEYGSLDSLRASAQFGMRSGDLGISGSGGWLRSDGIDSFGGGGDRDGFQTRSANLKVIFSPIAEQEIGLSGHWIDASSGFDGFDPASFRRADTLDSTDNKVMALRGWAASKWKGWSLLIDGDFLESDNRNMLDDAPLNRTAGSRFTLGTQLSRQIGRHRFTGAIEYEGEDFRARDQSFFGQTDQDRSRDLNAYVGEWHAEWSQRVATDVALRHDDFSEFADATTLRASILFRPAAHWALHGSYGEGIAQPTFYDLYGFFPGSFVGNPDLKPERSKGWEAGLRWETRNGSLGLTGFSNRLQDEIVDIFDNVTFLGSTANADGRSRRRGAELEGRYSFSPRAELLLNYTYLESGEQQVAGKGRLREVRRPRHSANAALVGSAGKLSWGASLSYVGKRQDVDFDLFPAPRITLDDYLLGSLKLGYQVSRGLEAYARVENGFDADYQDVIGYNTPGRTVYAGLRLHLGR